MHLKDSLIYSVGKKSSLMAAIVGEVFNLRKSVKDNFDRVRININCTDSRNG